MIQRIVPYVILFSFLFYTWNCTSMKYLSHNDVSNMEKEQTLWIILLNGEQVKVKEPKIKDTKLMAGCVLWFNLWYR